MDFKILQILKYEDVGDALAGFAKTKHERRTLPTSKRWKAEFWNINRKKIKKYSFFPKPTFFKTL